MDATNSILLTVIERIRSFMDEPEVSGKYTNSFLVSHVITPAMVDVLTRLSMGTQVPVVLQHTIELVAGTTAYQLPASIGEVWRLAVYDTEGRLQSDWTPSSFWNPWGQGWRLEANQLVFQPQPLVSDTTWVVDYMPTVDIQPHYATDGTLAVDLTEFTLSGSPTLGLVDRRVGAYAGQILRLIPASGPIEERVIASHDASAGTVTVRTAFTYQSSGGSKRYEILGMATQSLCDAITMRSAMKVAVMRGAPERQIKGITLEYQNAMKSLFDRYNNAQVRVPKSWERSTGDNETGLILPRSF